MSIEIFTWMYEFMNWTLALIAGSWKILIQEWMENSKAEYGFKINETRPSYTKIDIPVRVV